MAYLQKAHADPSRVGPGPCAEARASAGQDLQTSQRRETPSPILRTGLPQTIRRNQLRLLVPLADSTIYEMEQRGEFPRRFSLTSRCVVWDLAEVEAWIEQRKRDSYASRIRRAPAPDVHMRRTRPTGKAARADQ
jgi:prophage regulatory protein